MRTLTAGDPRSLAIQFGLIFLVILAYTYLAVFLFRRWTFVKSHYLVLILVVVTSIATLSFYRICAILNANIWLAFVAMLIVWGGPLNVILRRIDGGRALIDIDPERKWLFRTDYRIVRIAGQGILMFLLFEWARARGKL